MAKGFLVMERAPSGLEEIAREVGNFDIKSNLCMFFDPKKIVYKKIEKQGRKLGAHIAVIGGTSNSSFCGTRFFPGSMTTYGARGVFYIIPNLSDGTEE